MNEFTEADKVEYRRLLDEIAADYCPRGTYCIFKEMMIHNHPSRRTLVQLKCIDKRKYIKSKELGYDIGWGETFNLWISEGHAELFSKFYNDNITYDELFKLIIS